MFPRSLLLVCALVLLSAAWGASDRAAAQPRPCADEVRRLCPEVTPGRNAIAKCLRPHFDEIAPACRNQLLRMERRQKALRGRRKQVRTARAEITPSPLPTKKPE